MQPCSGDENVIVVCMLENGQLFRKALVVMLASETTRRCAEDGLVAPSISVCFIIVPRHELFIFCTHEE